MKKSHIITLLLVLTICVSCNFDQKKHNKVKPIETPETSTIEKFPNDSLKNLDKPEPITEELVGINMLKKSIGKYPTQEKIFQNETLSKRLKNMSGLPYESLLQNWNTETPITIENNIIHSSGCKAHDCPSNAFELFIDLENDNINVYHFRDNTLKIYQEKGRITLPKIYSDEIEIKKKNANIGNINTTESNYIITPQSYSPNNSDDAVAEKITGYLTNNLLKKDLNILTDDQREFQYESVDLNADGIDEYFVGFQNNYFCGSGGCTYLLIDKEGNLITKFTVSDAPFIVMPNKTNGWKDLLVSSDNSLHLLKFDGKSYPKNPSVAPKFKEIPGEKNRRILSNEYPIPNYEF